MASDTITDNSNKTRVSVYCVYFDDHNRVLLVNDANSLLWGFPGGGLEPGETHDDALHREFTEETGMVMRGASTYITRQDDDVRQRYFYKIEYVGGRLNKLGNDDDVLEVAYFNAENLPSSLASGVEEIVTQQIALLH